MKPYLCALLLLAGLSASAQFTVSGRVRNFSGQHKLTINVPVVFGNHKENTVPVPLSATGTFQIKLPADSVRFVTLIYRRLYFTLLLEPRKNLEVEFDENTDGIRITGGTAKEVNQLIQDIGMDKVPFYWENDSLGKLPAEGIQSAVIAPWFREFSGHAQSIRAAAVPASLKDILIAETYYLHVNYLNDFISTVISDRQTVHRLKTALYDTIPIAPRSIHPGPQYFSFADSYIRYLEAKAFIKIKSENIPASAPIPWFGISLDSANIIVNKYGKSYWRWLGSIRNFPVEVAEAYNWQQIQDQYNDGDIAQALPLAAAFRQRFPESRFLPAIANLETRLRDSLAANSNNERIAIVENYGNVRSIYDVVKNLKGKVVYLDMWGTWCGPCKEEFRHLPALRKTFAGKDVVFLYLDVDDDSRDAAWKDFIRVNRMEGLHLRMTRKTVDPIWKEILANHPDKSESYPQYFLFDKSGKLAIAKAERPSSGDALSQQIHSLLAQ
ncbi:TlpA family protein disulfide reductase [Chitinophaga rhizosphaerae]|uniref:TlpA family protein disulfide reductase n=1 Tax=Chitinophaga rhizosphaerae TaxID=1864947 RepID=UPI000F80E695|nr:TlpA disulfide reductase family protein [Chitinophaga rhizosphaerae]